MIIVFTSIIIALVILSAFFSSSETAFFSLTPYQIKAISDKHPSIGEHLQKWHNDPAVFLSTILTGNTLVNFAIASLGYSLFSLIFSQSVAVVATIPTFTILLLIFGEIMPKQLALRNAQKMMPFIITSMRFWIAVLKPLSFMMSLGTSIFKDFLTRERRALSDDELHTIIKRAQAYNILDSEEASMVEGVMRLPDLYVINEMTPRIRLVGVEANLTDEEKVKIANDSDYPYLPVYEKDMDHIVGFLNVDGFLKDPAHRASTWTHEPMIVEEMDGLDDVLVLFAKTGRRIALVKDRWGGTAGIITRGDILELIVRPVQEDDESVRPAREGRRATINREMQS